MPMRISLALGPRRPLDRAMAWGCLTTNLAIPGCGSLVAGRASGYWQFVIVMAGEIMTVYFGLKLFFWYQSDWAHLQQIQPDSATNFHELWLRLRWLLLGMSVFGVGWLWALGSSLSILAEAKKATRSAPPVLSEQRE